MKLCILFLFYLCGYNYCNSQNWVNEKSQFAKTKSTLDTSVLGTWPYIHGGRVTCNGKYISYIIQESFPRKKTITVVKHIEGKWKKAFDNILDIQFTSDSKQVVFIEGDRLYYL